MAYLNRLPQLSRIAPGTRNDDFIPIIELKNFDALMAEIVEKLKFMNNANSEEAASIASKLKDIEYNLADAFIFDDNGNIIGKNSHINSEGVEVPTYGQYAMDTMLQTIDSYYNEFVKLMGNDPNVDYWKVDLDKYYKEAIEEFKNKINSVFINSANAAALEGKVSEVNDYVRNKAVDMSTMTAMRLNPDIAAFTRNITISPVGINIPTIVFEIEELEKDSFVLNLKLQNGSMFYDLNIVLDNGKWDVKCVNSCNVNMDNNISIDVYKYEYSGKIFYVFTLNTDHPNDGIRFNFEIEGILVGAYRFNATGFGIEDHDRYFKYTLATVDKPVYTEIYYTKENQLDENGDVARVTYIPHEKLNAFLPDTEYYTRTPQFDKIKKIDIRDVSENNRLVGDPKLSVVTDDIIFTKNANKLHVSYEISEAIDGNSDEDITDRNMLILENPKITPNNAIRMFEAGKDYIAVANKDVREIDGGLSCGYGHTMFDIVSLRPGKTINTSSAVNKILNQSVIDRLKESYTLDESVTNNYPLYIVGDNRISKTIDKYELLDDTFESIKGVSQIFKFDASIDPNNEYSRTLNRELKNDLIFCSEAYIRILKRTEYTYDILIIPDPYEFDTNESEFETLTKHIETGGFYIILTTNLPTNPNNENVLVYRGLTNTEFNSLVRNPTIETRDWIGAASDDKKCILLRSDGLSYTYDGQLVYDIPKNKKFVNTGTPMEFNDHLKIKYDGYKFFFIWDSEDIEIPEDELPANAADLGTLLTHTNKIWFSENGFDWYLLDLRMFRAKAHTVVYSLVDQGVEAAPIIGTKYFTLNGETYEEAVGITEFEPDTDYYKITSGTLDRISYANDPTTWDADDSMSVRTDANDDDPFIFKPYGPDRYSFILPGYSKCVILTEEGLFDVARWTKLIYTENDSTELFGEPINPEHIYITPFHCANFTYTKTYYIFIDVDEGKIAYAVANDTGTINDLITTFTKVAISGLVFNSLTAYDFHFEGIATSNIILWGEGRRDPVNKGWYKAAYNAPGTWAKNSTITMPIRAVAACLEVYVNPSNNTSKLNGMYRMSVVQNGTESIYHSNDDGVTVSLLSNQILNFYIVGMNKNMQLVNNDIDGTIHFKEIPTLKNNSSGSPIHPLTKVSGVDVDGNPVKIATTSKAFACSICCREALTDNTFSICIFNDDNGYLHSVPIKLNPADNTVATTSPVYMYKAPAIRELYDSDYGIYGNTDDYAVSINKKYTEAYDPTDDRYGGSDITTSIIHSTYGPLGFYPNRDELGKISIEAFNYDNTFVFDDLNFGANKMFVSVNASNHTISESKEYFIFGSDTTKGAKLIKASDLIDSDVEFDAASMSHMIPGVDAYIQNAFECKYGLFMYGKDDNNRTKLYLLSNDHSNEDIGASVKEMLEVETIDFIKDIDEDIIISTYDSQNPYDKYTFNKSTISFDKSVAIDISDVYSFDNIIQHDSGIYFVNGTGSNPIVHAASSNNIGIFRISKSLNNSGVINTDINQFVKNEGIFGTIVDNRHVEYVKTSVRDEMIIASGTDQYGKYHAYMWLINFNGNTIDERLKKFSKETANPINDKAAYDIATIVEHNAQLASDDNPFGFVVQKSAYKLEVFKKDLSDRDKVTTNIADQFIIDDYIFDKSNNSITLKNYGISGDDRFIMTTEKIAMGKTIATDKTNIAIALGEDNAIALYDSDLDTLKVIKLQYNLNGQVVRFDSNYHTVQSVIIGSSNTENTIYIIAYGRFPTVIGTTLQYNDKLTYKLFSLSVTQAKQPNEYITVTEEQFVYADTGSPRDDIKQYISTYENCKPSSDMELYTNEKSNLQFIGIVEGIRYENVYSLVYWDKAKNCISMYTRYLADSTLVETDENDEGIVGPFAEGMPYYHFVTGKGTTPYEEQMVRFAPFGNNGYDAKKMSSDNMETYVKLPVICLTNRKTINLIKEKSADYSGDLIAREYDELLEGNNITSRPYNLHIQTQLGVFRYQDHYIHGEKFGNNVRSAKKVASSYYVNTVGDTIADSAGVRYGFPTALAEYSYRNRESGLWFTPENTNAAILIKTPELGKVTDIFETSAGVFIQVRQVIIYASLEHTVYKLYRVDSIPYNSEIDMINISDTRYFTPMDTFNAEIRYIADTRLGLLASAIEPKGLTTIKSGLNSDLYPGKSFLFYYNGVDFVPISYSYNNPNEPSAIADWINIYAIFDIGEHTYALSTPNRRMYEISPSSNGTGFTLTNVTSQFNAFTKVDATETSNNPNPFISVISDYNIQLMFDRRTSYSYPACRQYSKDSFMIVRPIEPTSSPSFDNTYGLVFYDFAKKVYFCNGEFVSSTHDFDYVPYPGIMRSPVLKPNDSYKRNELLRELVKRNLPVDKNLRAYGFIVYNNLKINIDGVRIVSDNGDSNVTPAAIVFNIDKNFRFNKDSHEFDDIVYLFGDGRIYIDSKDTSVLHKANFDIIY